MTDINFNEMTASEIDEKIVELEKELRQAIVAHETVEQSKLLLQREILTIQVKKKDFEMSLSKSATNIRQLNVTLRIARSKFWSAKNSGL